MNNSTPDYSSYNREELIYALGHIDKDAYPERVLIIESELKKRSIPPLPKVDKKGQKLILGFWPISVLLILYFGKLPSKQGAISYQDDPFMFSLCLIIYICVGIYFYNKCEALAL